MTFLSPAYLWVLPAAALPWLLRRFARPRPPRRPFPDLRLLSRVAREGAARARRRSDLLLVVRTLFVVTLIVYFAGPVRRGAVAPVSGLPLWVVLDASYSMSAVVEGRAVFDAARSRALDALNAATPGARVAAAIVTDRVEAVATSEEAPESPRRLVTGARTLLRPTDLPAALSELSARWGSGPVEVRVVTDAAAHGWAGRISTSAAAAVRRWTVIEVGSRVENAGAVGVEVEWDPAGARVVGEARAEAWGAAGPFERSWTARVNGAPFSLGRVTFSGGRGKTTFAGIPSGGDVARLEWRLEADALPADDAYYALARRVPPPRLLVVNGAPNLSPLSDELYYLRPVLDAWAREGARYALRSVNDVTPDDWVDRDVVVLANVERLSGEARTALDRFVAAGGGLWRTAGDRSAMSGDDGPAELDINDAPRPSRDPRAPAGVWNGEEVDWAAVRVRRAVRWDEPTDGVVLLRGARTGRPLLTLERRGRGRVVHWASTIDRDWTNLPAKAAYPILVRDVLSLLAAPASPSIEPLTVGDEWPAPFNGAAYAVERPDGSVDPRPAGERAYRGVERPGLYRARTSDGRTADFAVNLARGRGEGETERVAPDRLSRALRGADVRWVAASEETSRGVSDVPLRPVLGVLLVALLALETVLITGRPRS